MTSAPRSLSTPVKTACSCCARPTQGSTSKSSLLFVLGVIRLSSGPGRCTRTTLRPPTSLSAPMLWLTIPPRSLAAPPRRPLRQYHQSAADYPSQAGWDRAPSVPQTSLAAPMLAGIGPGPCAEPSPSKRGALSTAQTVSPVSSARTPQASHRQATMLSPRPPSEDTDAWLACGLVGLPPSLTVTGTELSSTSQVTRSLSPGSGYACRMALLSSSLTTRAASPTAQSKIPASLSSADSALLATATLAGAHGSSTTLDALTSLPARPDAATR